MWTDGGIAKTSDPNSAAFFDQDVCLAHEANVNRVARMFGGGTYRLKVPVDNPQAVHAVQTSSYFRQLLARRLRGVMNSKWD